MFTFLCFILLLSLYRYACTPMGFLIPMKKRDTRLFYGLVLYDSYLSLMHIKYRRLDFGSLMKFHIYIEFKVEEYFTIRCLSKYLVTIRSQLSFFNFSYMKSHVRPQDRILRLYFFNRTLIASLLHSCAAFQLPAKVRLPTRAVFSQKYQCYACCS